MSAAMAASKAWPAVFQAGSARILSRAALGAMKYEDDMEDALLKAAREHEIEPVTLSEAWDTMVAALADEPERTIAGSVAARKAGRDA
jgi:hypothetical protein